MEGKDKAQGKAFQGNGRRAQNQKEKARKSKIITALLRTIYKGNKNYQSVNIRVSVQWPIINLSSLIANLHKKVSNG